MDVCNLLPFRLDDNENGVKMLWRVLNAAPSLEANNFNGLIGFLSGLQLEKATFELAAARNQVKEMSTANAKIRAELKRATAPAPPSPDTQDPAAKGVGHEPLRAAGQKISALEAELGQQKEELQASKAAVAELQAASTSLQASRDSLQVSYLLKPSTERAPAPSTEQKSCRGAPTHTKS